jgi:hypothetical protein
MQNVSNVQEMVATGMLWFDYHNRLLLKYFDITTTPPHHRCFIPYWRQPLKRDSSGTWYSVPGLSSPTGALDIYI